MSALVTEPRAAVAAGVTLVRGDAARARLADPAFRGRWAALHARCPWASVFQGPEFLDVWFRVYGERFEPLLVVADRDADRGDVADGLLVMAVERATGRLLVAGDHHAEYQAWLADEGTGDAFIVAALDALTAAFPGRTLRIGYTPAATPMAWTRSGPWAARVEAREVPCGFADTASPEIEAILRKRPTRWRLNRLGRMGPIAFERVADADALAAMMPEIETLCDFRQAAANDVRPFLDDPLKGPFHLALARETSILHATVLRAGSRILSAQLNMRNGDSVLLCVLGHAPVAARHSPGHLHMLMLCREMAGEGVPWFDLSPGGEYKDRIATRHEMSYDLRVHLGALPAARARARRTAVRLARTAAARLGDERAARVEAGVHALAARAASTVRRAGAAPAELPAALARRARRAVSSHVELRVYSMPAERARALPDAGVMRRDAIDDLLCYRPAGSDAAPRQAFYASSMARLARDCHVYTHRVGDDLAHYGWLWEREERSVLAEVGRALRLPPNSAMLFDYYTHPAYRGQGLYGGSLRQMARAAALVADTEWVFITVHADNGASRRVIEKVGFDYRFSFFEERRLGAVRRWSTSPPEFDGGELDAVPPAAEGGAPATADEG